jgi:hypothetical protein
LWEGFYKTGGLCRRGPISKRGGLCGRGLIIKRGGLCGRGLISKRGGLCRRGHISKRGGLCGRGLIRGGLLYQAFNTHILTLPQFLSFPFLFYDDTADTEGHTHYNSTKKKINPLKIPEN